MLNVEITSLPEKRVVGMSLPMSLADDKTISLWKRFRPLIKELDGVLDQTLYSIQVYPSDFTLDQFVPTMMFTRWAAVEAKSEDVVLPEGMESLTIPGGDFARFVHRGPASTFPETWKSIFFQWLPSSDFELDARPHFEVFDSNYHPADPSAQEEIYIPVRRKH